MDQNKKENIDKTKDYSSLEILDLRLKKPIEHITSILEQINNKKTFNLTLIGSLSIIIVFLIIITLGTYTANAILCEKGTQVRIGFIRQLQTIDDTSTGGSSLISKFLKYSNTKSSLPKYILIRNNEDVIQIAYDENIDISQYTNSRVIATGSYNTCSNSLKITEPNEIEKYISIPQS